MRLRLAISTAILAAAAACAGSAGSALLQPTPEHSVQIFAEDIVAIGYVNDDELDPPRTTAGRTPFYAPPGNLQIYFNVELPRFTAQNMGVKIGADSGDVLQVCAGSRPGVARQGAFRLSGSDKRRVVEPGQRKSLCDRLTRRLMRR